MVAGWDSSRTDAGVVHFVSQLCPGRLAAVSSEDTHDHIHDHHDDHAGHDHDPDDAIEEMVDEAMDVLEDTRRRLAEVPAQVVVLNHAMGLYELAAIHLSATPPNLTEAALAIDAVACLVEGLGDRLGDDIETLRAALSNIQMAFVQIKQTVADAG